LIALLDHINDKVVEASLAALSTLLEDDVNVEEGVSILCEMEGIKPIIDVLLEKKSENLIRRAVWMVERLLRTEDIAYEISGNPNVGTALVDAFKHGDYRTRQIAERALRHIDKIPNFSGVFPNAGIVQFFKDQFLSEDSLFFIFNRD
nr:U-box domain-containing protein 44-like [Tanacetum cinerariifolium]